MKIKNLGEVILAIKSHLEEYLNEQGIETGKGNFNCIFPDHEDKHPSCHLYKKSNGDHRGYCFSCGKSFDLIDACIILEGKPKTGKEWATETIKYLADKYGEEIQIEELTEEDTYEINTYAAYKAAAGLLQTHFNGEEKQQSLKKEVERRGWTEETLREHTIGGILDYNEFINKLREQGFSITFLREIDLAKKELFGPNNLIFTWKDEHGRPVGFTARNLNYEEEIKEAKEGTTKPRKYNNIRTTGLKCNIFRKNSRLYGIDTALKTAPPLWIFEGQADVITAKSAGLMNCVCFSGGNLSEDQIHLVKKLGIYKIIICTDGDRAGREKLQSILDQKLSGHKDIDVKVVILPEGEDPDSFIRKNGIDAFRKLNQWTAFEWRLNQFSEGDDPVDICKAMIQFVASEASPVRREQLCRTLADRIDFPLKTIQDELAIILDSKAYEASRERDTIITKLIHELRSSPTDADEVIRAAQTDLIDLSIKFKGDSFGIDDCLQAVIDQKQEEESKTNKYEGFSLGDDLRPLEDNLQGDWTKDVCMFIGGKPSHGKSALMSKIAYEVATRNEDTIVIYHSIDDTRTQIIPRLVCIAEGSKKLSLNQTRSPSYWGSKPQIDYKELIQRRNTGYSKVIELVKQGRLIVKDVTNGKSMSFIEGLLQYHKSRSSKVLYILDNFHKLDWFSHVKDERVRWKKTSERMKELIEKHHTALFATVEYPKIPPGQKPNDNNISECVQILYDANFTIHLYSELADMPDQCSTFHTDLNYRGETTLLPRVEAIIGKNKIASTKNGFFLDFWPEASDYRYIDLLTVIKEQQEAKQVRNQERNSDPLEHLMMKE